jgi:hypothetical protein
MNPKLGWLLAAVGAVAGWQAYGWRGLVLVATITAFWLLLQFNRAMRVMRNAAQAPVGHVDSAVMLQAKLHEGMPLIEIVTLTKSLGHKMADEPETYEWRDDSGAAVNIVLKAGRAVSWTLRREAQ